MRVRWKNTASTPTSTAAVAAADISSLLMRMPATFTDSSGMPTSSFLTLAPHSISPNPSRKKLSPMVAMNRMMGAWLTSGRSTTRSMPKASAIMTATVRRSATAAGSPFSMSPTRVRAANSTMTPWAKLKTPEALKIRTKPSATREYMSPAAIPPMSTSTKNAGALAMSRNGATSTAWRRLSMRHPQVGVDHRRVRAHLVRRPVGDLAPVVERDHVLRDVHDHAHVVLDEGDGRAELVVDAQDEPAHVLLFLEVHARHGLVEEEEGRLGGEGARQLHALLQPVRQPARGRLANGLDLQEVDDALDEGAVLELLTLRRPPVEAFQEEAPAHLQQAARHDVVEHAHALEQRHVLKGARDAQRGHIVGLEVGAVLAVEADVALVGMVEAADHVEERGLPRPVRPDDGGDLAAPDREAHALQRLHRAEAHADPLHLEQRRAADGLAQQAPATTASAMRTSARTVPTRPSS